MITECGYAYGNNTIVTYPIQTQVININGSPLSENETHLGIMTFFEITNTSCRVKEVLYYSTGGSEWRDIYFYWEVKGY